MKIHRIWGLLAISMFCVMFSRHSFAQEPPIKWGEIPREDLAMKSYSADSNASALILCDYCNCRYDWNRDRYIYEYIKRIKIFSASGYKYATHKFSHIKKWEFIDNIEGVTYYLDENNAVVKTELKEEDIQTKDLNEYFLETWFTMPALRPSCIVEFRHTLISNFEEFADWTYQTDQPVRWSEYQILYPVHYKWTYVAVHQGRLQFATRENTVEEIPNDGVLRSWNKMRWVVKDAPALRKEPFMTTIGDYVQRTFLFGVESSEGKLDDAEIARRWKKFVEYRLEDESFYKKIDDTRQIRKIALELTSNITSPLEKVKALQHWVANNIRWNEYESYYAWRDQDDILKDKKGNVADINFILLSLLKCIGIEGDPIITSTRENGKFIETFPVRYHPNYMVGRAKIDSQYYYLDATDPQRPFNLLPTSILNARGVVVKKDTVEWVTITSPKLYNLTSLTTLNVNEDGSCYGTLEDSYKDYGGYFTRMKIKDKNNIDIAKDVFNTEESGISIDSANIENRDSIDLPVQLKAWISSSNYAQQAGDIIYINPHVLHRFKDNPFKIPKREFPVDYSYGTDQTIVTNMIIPKNFEIKEPLANRTLIVGANLVKFIQKVQVDSDRVQILNKFEIRKTQLGPEFYDRLREVYGQIVAIQSQQLVLERKKVSSPAVKQTPSEIKPPRKKGKK